MMMMTSHTEFSRPAVGSALTEAPAPLAASVGRLLTSVEVASIIRVPHATLRYWRHMGIGPKSFKMGPRRVLYREEDVLAWVAQQYAHTG